MNSSPLELFLFAPTADWLARGRAAGLTSFIVDWEWRGKEMRQCDRDTEINRETADDLRRLGEFQIPRRVCRINSFGPWTSAEIETAIEAGATDLFLPMVRQASEVESMARQVRDRCRVGILIETVEAVANARDLARTEIDFVYVGLHDLAISRKCGSLFDSLVDGTVDRIREAFADLPFGCAGVTAIDCGEPVPFSLLIRELARLRCDFTFARRSFRRDMEGRDLAAELQRIEREWTQLLSRAPLEIEQDRREFTAAVRHIGSAPSQRQLMRAAQ